jgi:DNA-binding transcriptional regulator LsrR (DeoR family)
MTKQLRRIPEIVEIVGGLEKAGAILAASHTLQTAQMSE